MPDEDWDRLAAALDARITELGMTQAEIQAAGGPSPAKVREVVNRRATAMSPSKRRDLERAVDWTPGSIDRTLAGGDPTPLSDDAGLFLSKLRHPNRVNLVADAIESDDKELVAALEEVLETGQVSPNALSQLQRLHDDATIKHFPKTYELLSRGGKLKVARYGQDVRLAELQQQGDGHDVETAPESNAPTEGDKDEEVRVDTAWRVTEEAKSPPPVWDGHYRTMVGLLTTLASIDPALDFLPEFEQLTRAIEPSLDTPMGMRQYIVSTKDILGRARDKLQLYSDDPEQMRAIDEMLTRIEEHANAASVAAGAGSVSQVRPASWGQSPPPPTTAKAASKGYKQSDDERDDTE